MTEREWKDMTKGGGNRGGRGDVNEKGAIEKEM